jgi:hypothetical protein
MLAEIEAEAERLLGEREPVLTDELFRVFAETGERLSYEGVYFAKRKRLNAFALMAWLKPEGDVYAGALRQAAKAICDERTWCLPAHYNESRGPLGNIDLFAAETGQALTELAELLGDVLGEELVARIAIETERRIFGPFLSGSYHWERLDNNWSSVCAGSIGMAALYAIEDSERLAALLERVHAAMDVFLSGYGQDGACLEGYSYWQYGFGYYVYYMDLLKAATSGGLNGFAERKVREIAMFQQRCFTSEDMIVSFSDSPERSGVYMGLTMRLRREFQQVALPDASFREPYAADHCGRWAHALRNVMWAAEGGSQAKKAEGGGAAAESVGWPTETRYMADAQWFLSRHVPEEGRSYSFAAKGGHNGEPHNHNDGGQFLLHAEGEAYLADLGRGLYTKSYFGPERYTYWCNGSQGHSVPIVNGAHQEEGEDRKAIVLEASIGETEDLFALELKGMYPAAAGLRSFQRKFRWTKSGAPALTVSDKFSFTQAGALDEAIIERFITMTEPRQSEDGALLLEQKRKLRIHYDSGNWRAVATRRSDFDHFGRERFWYTLDFHPVAGSLSGEIEAVFTFAFLPGEDEV